MAKETVVAAKAAVSDADFRVVGIEQLVESKTNPRRVFPKDALADLTKSVAEKGVLVPLLVRPTWSKLGADLSDPGAADRTFEILAGARRFRAAQAAGLKSLPVLVRDLDDTQALEVQVIENLQRQDVHPLEEAEGYKRLLFGTKYTVETLADKVGKSASYVYQRLKLAELSDEAKKLFQEGKMTAGHAILLARLQPNDQKKAIKAEGPNDWRKEFCSVRELTDWIKQNVHLVLSGVAFPLDDSQRAHGGIKSSALVPGAKACIDCPKRTGANPQLFADVDHKDTCTDPSCFHGKERAFVRIQLEMYSGAKKLSAGDFYGQKAEGLTGWKPVKSECKGSVSGVVVQVARYSGTNEKIGQYHPKVCINQSCSVHRPKAARAYDNYRPDPKAEARRKAEEALNNKVEEAMLAELLPAIAKAKSLPAEDLVIIADFAMDGMYGGGEERLETVFGLKDCHSKNELKKLSREKLLALVLASYVAEGSLPNKELGEVAKRHGVDVSAIREKVKKEAKVSKAAAKEIHDKFCPNGKGAKPQKGTCRICGCTETTPCDVGIEGACAWADKSMTLCTNPDCLKAAKAKPAKKAKKAA